MIRGSGRAGKEVSHVQSLPVSRCVRCVRYIRVVGGAGQRLQNKRVRIEDGTGTSKQSAPDTSSLFAGASWVNACTSSKQSAPSLSSSFGGDVLGTSTLVSKLYLNDISNAGGGGGRHTSPVCVGNKTRLLFLAGALDIAGGGGNKLLGKLFVWNCLVFIFSKQNKFSILAHRDTNLPCLMEAAAAAYASEASRLEAECKVHNAAALAAFSATIPTGTVWAVAAPPAGRVPRILFFALYPPKQAAAGADPYDNSTCRAIHWELQHTDFMFVDLLPLAPLVGVGEEAAARATQLLATCGNASGVSQAEVLRALDIRRSVRSTSLAANAVRRLLAAVTYVRACGHVHPVVAVCGEVAAAHWRKAPAVVHRADILPQVSLWQDAHGGPAFMVVHIAHPSAQWHGQNRARGGAVLTASMQLADALSVAPLCGGVRRLAAWAATQGSPAFWHQACLEGAPAPLPPSAWEVHFYVPTVRAAFQQVRHTLGLDAFGPHVLCGRLNTAHFAEDVCHWVRAMGAEAARPALGHAAFADALVRFPGAAARTAVAWVGACTARAAVVGPLALVLMHTDLAAWVNEFIGVHGTEAYPVLANPELGRVLVRRRDAVQVVDAWIPHAGSLDALATPGFIPQMWNEAFMARARAWAEQGRLYSSISPPMHAPPNTALA